MEGCDCLPLLGGLSWREDGFSGLNDLEGGRGEGERVGGGKEREKGG